MDVDPIVRGLVRGLVHAPEDRGLRSRVRAHGVSAVPPLIELLVDRDLWSSESPGGGMAPIAAAQLLGELRAEGAVGPLADVLGDLEPMNALYSAVVRALLDVGSAATEPLLALAVEAER
jgi:hypothetical protein